MGGITGGNSLDFLKGCLCQLDISDWVTAGGAGTFNKTGGFMEDPSWEISRETAKIEADNCTYPLDAYPTKSGIIIKGTMLEASLRKLVLALGGATADVNVVAGTATLPIKELAATNWYQIKLTIAGQSMKPGHTEQAADIYVKRTATLWRCLFKAKVSQSLKAHAKCPFEIEVFYDTSVVESATKGALGAIADTTV